MVAYYLCDGRFAGGVVGDRLEDGFFEFKTFADAEVLSEIEVGPAIARHKIPKGQIGNILHRGQCGARRLFKDRLE